MFITTLKIILNLLYLLLVVTTILIIVAFVNVYSGESINVPLFIYVLFQYGINIVLVIMLRKSIDNLNFKKVSKLNGYDDIVKQIKDVQTQMIKGFATMSLEETKKQFERQYKEVTEKKSKEDRSFIIPSVDAEVVDKDDSFSEFDHDIEGYAHIAKNTVKNDLQEELKNNFTAQSYNIDQMTILELKELCKLYGVVGYSKLKKSELIEILRYVIK
jgi:hypothetical protein